MMSSSPNSFDGGSIRRGMKVRDGSRPGTVVIVAKASAPTDNPNDDGLLEVPETEYLAFEEADRLKHSNDPSISEEQKALASVTARKFLNKWRERWASAKRSRSSEPTPRAEAGSPMKRKGRLQPPGNIVPFPPPTTLGDGLSMQDTPSSAGLSASTGPMEFGHPASSRSSRDGDHMPLDVHHLQRPLDGASESSGNRHSDNGFEDPQMLLLQNLVSLEAGQSMLLQRLTALEADTQDRLARLETNMAALQSNQANIESGILRILEALRRNQ